MVMCLLSLSCRGMELIQIFKDLYKDVSIQIMNVIDKVLDCAIVKLVI